MFEAFRKKLRLNYSQLMQYNRISTFEDNCPPSGEVKTHASGRLQA